MAVRLYGRRKSDGFLQVLIWLQVALAVSLWGVNVAHMLSANRVLRGMREETAAAAKERIAVGKVFRDFVRILEKGSKAHDQEPGEPL